MPRKLKVFRTPIGFHDAYVAAASQRAALEAWGADSNLFAQGIAEVVTDPALIAEPLAHPGEVIRLARGSTEEHVRALGDGPKPRARPTAANEDAGERPATGRRSPASSTVRVRSKKPTRAAVEKAEAALARTEEAHRAALEKLRAEQEALDVRRREIEQDYRHRTDELNAQLHRARDEYRRAMAEWAAD